MASPLNAHLLMLFDMATNFVFVDSRGHSPLFYFLFTAPRLFLLPAWRLTREPASPCHEDLFGAPSPSQALLPMPFYSRRLNRMAHRHREAMNIALVALHGFDYKFDNLE
ncbi:hypothetical protein C0995_001468, partial [Termitomyces sp. Mi166